MGDQFHVDESVLASRLLRGRVLGLLAAASRGGNAYGMTAEQVQGAFSVRREPVREPELRDGLLDLADRGLLEKKWDEQIRDDFYSITSRGRDFVRANYPWDRIDEFTGRV